MLRPVSAANAPTARLRSARIGGLPCSAMAWAASRRSRSSRDAPESAGRAEGADMQLENHRIRPWASAPLRRLPREVRIDQFARPVDIFGLKARSRIGDHALAVDAKAIARARPGRADRRLEPA